MAELTQAERQTAALETMALALTAMATPQAYPPGVLAAMPNPVADRLEGLVKSVRSIRQRMERGLLDTDDAASAIPAIEAELVATLATLGRDAA